MRVSLLFHRLPVICSKRVNEKKKFESYKNWKKPSNSEIFIAIQPSLLSDYESKQRQLNIAIRRLQLIDAHSRRIDMEKRIMNWEKAFAKVLYQM